MSEYRINYTIERADGPDDEHFEEIGFGSSGAWSDVDAAIHAVSSDIQNRAWEVQQ